MKTDAVIDEPKSQQVIPHVSAVCQQEGALSAILSAPALKETDHNSDLKLALYAAYAQTVVLTQAGVVYTDTIVCRNLCGEPGQEHTKNRLGVPEASWSRPQ